MPPHKDFSRKIDYLKRIVHDDFLEQISLSMNELARGRELIPKSPRILVGEGFYEK